MKRIGILGGTFDPPHYAHLLMAEQAYNQLELDEIWFLLSYQPTHKAEAKTTAKDRVEMTKAAIEGNPAFHISTVEVERKEKSYTLQTMKMIKEDFPNHQFYFIIGGDMVEYLPKWYNIEELLKLITFVGINRPGYTLKSPYPVEEVQMPLMDISSTMIRERLKEGKTIRYLTPPAVIDIINKYKLYS